MDRFSLEQCMLCPRRCRVNRLVGQVGYCGADARIKIGRYALHHWEEPPISGTRGSATVFFSGCNLGCVYCQNYKISTQNSGVYVSEEELCDIFLDLQKQGAHNINLVTPTHYIIGISNALTEAKKKGLTIPVVYNCGGYESSEALKMLDKKIDIYMPDMKYFNDKYARYYSKADQYFKYCSAAVAQMYEQVGKNEFDGDGIMKKGLIVRHLMLPGLLFDSKKILDYLYRTYKDDIYVSIMSQYTPMPQIRGKYPEIDRPLSKKYYDTLVNYAVKLGMTNVFIQEGGAAGESFIPDFF